MTAPAVFDSLGPLTDQVGKSGVLRLSLARDQDRTVIADQYWRIPLQVLPPSYQDADDEAYVYLLNPTGGVVQVTGIGATTSSASSETIPKHS